MSEKIAYVEHPVTPEHKKELRQKGFKIVDARFAPEGKQIEKSRAKKAKGDGKPSGGESSVTGAVTVVLDEGEQFVVELEGVQFSPARNQVRDDGTLTTGGVKAFEAAKLQQSQSE